MPANTVSVARPSRWGNPYVIGQSKEHIDGVTHSIHDAYIAVLLYREYMEYWLGRTPTLLDQLRGKNLACFCRRDQPCHADVLLELANR